MKFGELNIGDRFLVTEFGWSNGPWIKIRDNDHFEHNSKEENSEEELSIEDDIEVEKLGPTKDSSLGEAIKAFLKENLTLSVERYRAYEDEKGIKVTLSLCGEKLCSDRVDLS